MDNFRLNLCLPLSLSCLAALSVGTGPACAQTGVTPADSVTIINTGYGALPGYRITVGRDGHISSAMQPRLRATAIVRSDQMTALNRQEFFRDLSKAGPLSALPTGTGQRAMIGRRGRRTMVPSMTVNVPGPQVFVLYRGQRTPNLRAAGSYAGKTLYQDVKKIMQVLRLPIPNVP